MKLMTKEIEKQLPALYSTENIKTENKVVVVKYFTPFSSWTWYGVEYDPKEKLFFGWVVGFEKEWGYFSLDEFEEVNKDSPVLKIERDMYFKPTKMKDLEEWRNK